MKKFLLLLALVSLVLLASIQLPAVFRKLPTSPKTLRIGQFNIWEMAKWKIDETDEVGVGQNPQLLDAAVIIQVVAPDILIINEIDHDYSTVEREGDLAFYARRFNDLYLKQGSCPIDYLYAYAAPCNTGFLTGKDLDNDGVVATSENLGQREHGSDSYGYGIYPGQYSMAILSKYPFQEDEVRSFQKFRWIDLPDPLIPSGWFTEDELSLYRLSSKSHWDVPVQVGDKRIHLLLSHPTPTGYDGPEDLNGRRNHDEIRMWVHYINNDSVLVDDSGDRGGLAKSESFIIAGDLNADPGGDVMESGYRSIEQLLKHERVRPTGEFLSSEGALFGREPGSPDFHERNTVGWEGGGYRIDYILPSADLIPIDGGVYWPDSTRNPEGASRAHNASDHHMIWLDIALD